MDARELLMKKQALCLTCLKCCKLIAFPTLYPNNKIVKELYETRGWLTKYDEKMDTLWIYKEVPCQHLGPKGCLIYNKRPKACKGYDGRNDPILKEDCLWNQLGGQGRLPLFQE